MDDFGGFPTAPPVAAGAATTALMTGMMTASSTTTGTASSSRKRSRSTASGGRSSTATLSTTTTTTAAAATTIGVGTAAGLGGVRRVVESSDDRVRAAQLRDPKQRVKALNAILKLSNSHEINYALSGDSVLTSLLHIAMECMNWDPTLAPTSPQQHHQKDETNNQKKTKAEPPVSSDTPTGGAAVVHPIENDKDDTNLESLLSSNPVFSSAGAWKQYPTHAMKAWADHWKEEFGIRRCTKNTHDFKLLEVVVAILRNLSFVGANLRMLAYTPNVLAVLIGCMLECHDDYGSAAASLSSGSGGGGGSASHHYHSSTHGHHHSSSHPTSGAGGPAESTTPHSTDEATRMATSRINLTVNAMQTLIHLAPYLDISGHKILADRLFYSPVMIKEGPLVPDMASFGQTAGGNWGFGGMWLAKRLDTKEDVMNDVTKEFLLTYAEDYLVAVWSLFPALAHVLTNVKCPRPVMLVAVDLLQELINHARVGVVGHVDLQDKEDTLPTIRAVVVSMPDAVLERLVDLLYIPRLGPDALEYLDPVHNIVTRVTTLKLLMGYDATVDTDVRDRALDVLVPLLELDSPRMAIRLGTQQQRKQQTEVGTVRTRLWDALVPILTTSVGRSEATLLASQLFRELAKAPQQNKPGLLYVQERLVELASRDNRVAHLVWHFLYPVTVNNLSNSSGGVDGAHGEGNNEGHP